MRNGLNWGTSLHSKLDRFRDMLERSYSKRTKAAVPNKITQVRMRMRGSQHLTTSKLEHSPQNQPDPDILALNPAPDPAVVPPL